MEFGIYSSWNCVVMILDIQSRKKQLHTSNCIIKSFIQSTYLQGGPSISSKEDTRVLTNWWFTLYLVWRSCLRWNFHLIKRIFQRKNYGILLPKLVWPTVRKNCSTHLKKTTEIRAWRPTICKIFENSEISEQFWNRTSFKLEFSQNL